MSGATAAEAQNALIQFSQGLASGALRGDELRSVLEQLPYVADVLGKELGVTRGELRKMGTEGKITSEVILKAFKNMRGEISEKFAKTIPTLAQSFVMLKNSMTKTFGEMSANLGITSSFAKGVILLSKNVDTLVRSFGALAIVLSVSLAAKAIPHIITALNSLRVAMLANPITAIAVVLTSAIALLITFSDKIKLSGDNLAHLGDLGAATWSKIKKSFNGFMDVIKKASPEIKQFEDLFKDIDFSITALATNFAKKIDSMVGSVKAFFNVFEVIFKKLPEIVGSNQLPAVMKLLFVKAFNGAIKVVEESLNRIFDFYEKIFKFFKIEGEALPDITLPKFEEPKILLDSGFDIGKEIGQAIEDGMSFTGVQDLVENLLIDAEAIAVKRKKEAELSKGSQKDGGRAKTITGDKEFNKIIDALKQEAKLLGFSNAERIIQEGILSAEKELKRDLIDTERQLLDSMLRGNESLKLQNSLYEQIKGPVTEYKQTLEGLNALLEKNAISQNEYNAAIQQTQLAGSLQGVQSFLGTDEGNELQLLSDKLTERQNLTNQFLESELINASEHKSLMLQLEEKYNQDVQNIELSRYKMQLNAGQQTFSALAQVTKGFAGEQSSAYKAMFAISKGFAVAQSAIAIQQGIAEAIKLGWPQNIPAIAGVVSQGEQIVSTIQGTQTPGFQNGGTFGVGGSGGTDSQLVQFRATPNETVSVRTPGQERMANRNTEPQQQPQAINVVNVLDPAIVGEYLNSADGERTLVNSIQSNQTQIRGVMGRN